MADTPFTGINTLEVFPRYLSQEDYKAKTGKTAKPFNPDLPIKDWEDPAALTATSRNMAYEILEMTDTGGYKVEVGQEIGYETMLVPRVQAGQVNLMFAGTQPVSQFGVPVPSPMKRPGPNQKVVLQKFNQPAIRNTAVDIVTPGGMPVDTVDTAGLYAQNLYIIELLKAIGARVGIKII